MQEERSFADEIAKRESSRSAAGGQSTERPKLGRTLRNDNRPCRLPSGNLDFPDFKDPDGRFVQLVNSVLDLPSNMADGYLRSGYKLLEVHGQQLT
jgi:hypothetical protein